eukprot:TRINITY_DN123324_c0_g1_i1.p2 TRINITY_DN123324_c0_g1~~TRINITY_DN123324_c0_g1_i1.p2  ORF type:complete len:100 (-),score=1.25 TRINITY_DN123324_c0_g1_i1:49-348(-)
MLTIIEVPCTICPSSPHLTTKAAYNRQLFNVLSCAALHWPRICCIAVEAAEEECCGSALTTHPTDCTSSLKADGCLAQATGRRLLDDCLTARRQADAVK